MPDKPTYGELEQQVSLLEQKIVDQRYAEDVNRTLFRISNAVNTTTNLEALYASIHNSLSLLMDLPNFYIALYDKSKGSIAFPYFVDQFDHDYEYIENFSEDQSLTGDVILAGQPLLFDEAVLKQKDDNKGVIGTVPKIWMGVPLKTKNEIIGVMAVQSYTDPDYFNFRDLNILKSVSEQVAVAIERKRAQEKLHESEEMFRKLTENINDVIWSMDLELNFTYISPVVEKTQGWTAQEMMALSIGEVLMPESMGQVMETLAQGFMDGQATGDYSQAYTLVVGLRKKDGDVLRAEVTALFELGSDGLPLGILGVARDITQRLNAEEALRESEAKYRTLIETTDTGFVILDEDGCVLDANANYVHLSGRRELSEIMGRPAMDWVAVPCRERYAQALNQCMLFGSITNLEIDHVAAGGNCVPIGMNAACVEAKAGPQVMALCRDITSRKQERDIMIQSEKMLALGGLAAGMAHEINNPLAGILQMIQVIINRVSGDLPANHEAAVHIGISMDIVRRYMEQRGVLSQLAAIRDAGLRAARIVENMLAFSRKGTSNFTENCLEELLDTTVELINSDYNIKKMYDFRAITIHRIYETGMPRVFCERNTIQQVFFNILKNGAEAMWEQRGRAEKKGQPVEPPSFILRIKNKDGMAVVEIEDNGPGMEEEHRKRVFDPFFTTKEIGIGTGLGLSLSYFIVTKNHKGTMEVKSKPGKGSVFIMHIPIRQNP
ncbi:MAG: PAS domain S-box protein [Pseudomonadota bacterium]